MANSNEQQRQVQPRKDRDSLGSLGADFDNEESMAFPEILRIDLETSLQTVQQVQQRGKRQRLNRLLTAPTPPQRLSRRREQRPQNLPTKSLIVVIECTLRVVLNLALRTAA